MPVITTSVILVTWPGIFNLQLQRSEVAMGGKFKAYEMTEMWFKLIRAD